MNDVFIGPRTLIGIAAAVVFFANTCDAQTLRPEDLVGEASYADPKFCYVGGKPSGWDEEPGQFILENQLRQPLVPRIGEDVVWILEPPAGPFGDPVFTRLPNGMMQVRNARVRSEALTDTGEHVSILGPNEICYGAGLREGEYLVTGTMYRLSQNQPNVNIPGVGYNLLSNRIQLWKTGRPSRWYADGVSLLREQFQPYEFAGG